MKHRYVTWLALLAAASVELAGCMTYNSPVEQSDLKMISAGFTGCMPDDNVITGITPTPNYSGTWNATCRGKIYLCSSVNIHDRSQNASCAPVPQQ